MSVLGNGHPDPMQGIYVEHIYRHFTWLIQVLDHGFFRVVFIRPDGEASTFEFSPTLYQAFRRHLEQSADMPAPE